MSESRVVVVDDTQANLILLANILHDAGYDVRVANSAERALTLIEKDPPHLVLLDINLPEKDGYFVCREMKKKKALAGIPVIFLSAHDDRSAKNKAFEAGGVEYLVKPFEAAEVLARVATHLRLADSERELADLSAWRARAEETFAALCRSLTGTLFDGRYQILEKVEGEADWTLFRATRVSDSASVTLKVLLPGPDLKADAVVSSTGVPYAVQDASDTSS